MLTLGLATLYFAYHVFIDQSYRPSADDFAVTDLAMNGIPAISFAVEMYLGWEGPFLTMSMLGLVCWLAEITAPWVPLIMVKASLVGSTTILLRTLSLRTKQAASWANSLGMAVILNTGLYLIAPNQPEIWHWLVGTPYLMPLIFAQLGLAALINQRIVLAALPFAFVMQSRATYAVLIFGLLFLVSVYNMWNKNRRLEWAVFISVCLCFLLIYLLAPGNYVRMTEHGNSTAFLLSQFKVGLHNLFFSYNVAKLDRVGLSLLGLLAYLSSRGIFSKPRQAWHWTVPLFLYVSFALAHAALFVFITGYHEWTRVLSMHAFLFLVMCLVYWLWAEPRLTRPISVGKAYIGYASCLALVIYLFSGFGRERNEAQLFREQYDQRLERILSHKGIQNDTLYVKPIHYKGKLYFEDFSHDPDHWINKDFRKAYGLPFKIAVRQQEP